MTPSGTSKYSLLYGALLALLWGTSASATTLSPSVSGELFNDFTAANADTATPTATPFTLTGEFLSNEQFAVFEFDLSSIGTTVSSATFKFTGTSVQPTADLSVFGFDGDGLLNLDDLNNVGPNFVSFEPIDNGGTLVSLDVTAFVNLLLPPLGVLAGFEVWDNTLGPGAGTGATISNVTLELTPVPEPSTLALAAFGLFALAALGWLRRR